MIYKLNLKRNTHARNIPFRRICAILIAFIEIPCKVKREIERKREKDEEMEKGRLSVCVCVLLKIKCKKSICGEFNTNVKYSGLLVSYVRAYNPLRIERDNVGFLIPARKLRSDIAAKVAQRDDKMLALRKYGCFVFSFSQVYRIDGERVVLSAQLSEHVTID